MELTFEYRIHLTGFAINRASQKINCQEIVTMRKRSPCCCPLPCRRGSHCCLGSVQQLPFSNACITPSARRFYKNALQILLSLCVLLVLILWLGAEYEQWHVRNADDTLQFYNQDELGAVQPDTLEFQTVSRSNMSNGSYVIAHCGTCAACSNRHDISIYDGTKNTLFEDTTKCAKRALIWGRKTATRCMEELVGFTNDCEHCWVENIMCDLKYCVFSCMWYGLFNSIDGGDAASKLLNPCTECDEKRCGPAFIECAGANRRRSGILSDIERDERLEVCDDLTSDWWKDPSLFPPTSP